MASAPELDFPPGWFWGCSTSAHQIEGGLVNDWSKWEQSEKRIRDLKSRNLDPQDFISGHAANSYEESNADIACMEEIGLNAYRFSVDWSRIEPENGVFDEGALDFYLDFIKKLRAKKIEPLVTLWHWPLPVWVRDLGGWESKKTIEYFTRFTKRVVEYLNPEVNFWITLNEPVVYSTKSYLTGEWPPQKKSIFACEKVLANLVRAHRQAYDIIKKIDQNNKIGIAKHNIYFEAYKNQPINKILKKFADWWWNERYLNKIDDKQDFVGLNYYFHNELKFGVNNNYHYEKISDIGWGLHPEGIYYLLKDLKRYNKPIYITENGLADKGDQHRTWYIKEILKNVHKAVVENVPVKGYFHWSLIDNFEWAQGFSPRFGLYEVDFKSFVRKPRSSAFSYQDICKHNRI